MLDSCGGLFSGSPDSPEHLPGFLEGAAVYGTRAAAEKPTCLPRTFIAYQPPKHRCCQRMQSHHS